MKPSTDLLRPDNTPELRVQLALRAPLAQDVAKLCQKWGVEPAAACRILISEGLEARKRVA